MLCAGYRVFTVLSYVLNHFGLCWKTGWSGSTFVQLRGCCRAGSLNLRRLGNIETVTPRSQPQAQHLAWWRQSQKEKKEGQATLLIILINEIIDIMCMS